MLLWPCRCPGGRVPTFPVSFHGPRARWSSRMDNSCTSAGINGGCISSLSCCRCARSKARLCPVGSRCEHRSGFRMQRYSIEYCSGHYLLARGTFVPPNPLEDSAVRSSGLSRYRSSRMGFESRPSPCLVSMLTLAFFKAIYIARAGLCSSSWHY